MAPSLPAWGVWIEMWLQNGDYTGSVVTPRMGSVD